jgi:signal transduction histidine kinase
MVDQNPGRTSLPVPALPRVAASSPAAEYGNQAENGRRQANGERPRSRGALMPRNWRVRWRVLALVIVPTVAAILLGLVRIEAANTTAANFARISQLATLGRDFTTLTQSIEDERDLTAGYLASQQAGDKAQSAALLGQVQKQYDVTNTGLTAAKGLAEQVSSAGSSNPAATRNDVTSALRNLQVDLPDLRGFIHSEIDPLAMTDAYSQLLSPLLAFDNDIAAGSSNPQLALFATLLGATAEMEDQASQQRALLYAALFQDQFQPDLLTSLIAAQTDQASSLASFEASAASAPAFVPASGGTPAGFSTTLTEVQQFDEIVQGSSIDDAQRIELDAVIAGDAGRQPDGGVTNAAEWFTDMTSTLSDMRSFDAIELDAISSQAGTLQQGALGSERLTALIVLLLLLVVLGITIVVARSMILPLRRLRADALDVAGRRLPDMVRRLSESEGDEAGSIQIEPIGINSADEIGEVARAFDQVHREAVRLAGDEAMLRANLNAMFVNLSRRSQSLIERQLGIIDTLEQSEQEPERLSSLFRLDHLATRMRRNSENLLVLAGHEAPRKWGQPVPLVDVLRAAVSEIEQYERIALNVQPGIVIGGRTASDVVHLAAELVENATAFSPSETPVLVTCQRVSSGGVLIEISDQGLGIEEQELAYANWRLEHPPVVDVAVSRRMGLFVVGRLASRHGIRVKLRRPQSGGGLSALIWLPETVAENDETHAPLAGPSRRRLEAERYGETGEYATAGAVGGQPAIALRRPVSRPQVPEPAAPALRAQPGPGAALSSVTQPFAQPPAAPAASGWWQPTAVSEPPGEVVLPPARQEAAGPAGHPAYGAGDFPPADAPSPGLPIYDAVESDWFRRRGTPISARSGTPPAGSSWVSPADDGFQAAKSVVSPQASERTAAGLRKRVPGANLVPGSVVSRPAPLAETRPPETSVPARSAEAARNRLTSFQRGARAGRGAASGSFQTDAD